MIFVNGVHRIVGDCLGILVIILIILQGQAFGGYFIDTATFGSYPDMFPLYSDAVDKIAVQQFAAGIGYLVAYALEIVFYGVVYIDTFQAGNQQLLVIGYGKAGQEVL